ncbi:hypothetical protein AMTR_s00101p00073160 [Amborella trichopoda]|uniref:Uncharacterized protein n=1 Tax=Amborella trichopoda TaxID=13333 RepID=W1NUV8_AMBTC|nr:hypothetical protein AMTR_s00101p00073160 [Amborella trichopoda]
MGLWYAPFVRGLTFHVGLRKRHAMTLQHMYSANFVPFVKSTEKFGKGRKASVYLTSISLLSLLRLFRKWNQTHKTNINTNVGPETNVYHHQWCMHIVHKTVYRPFPNDRWWRSGFAGLSEHTPGNVTFDLEHLSSGKDGDASLVFHDAMIHCYMVYIFEIKGRAHWYDLLANLSQWSWHWPKPFQNKMFSEFQLGHCVAVTEMIPQILSKLACLPRVDCSVQAVHLNDLLIMKHLLTRLESLALVPIPAGSINPILDFYQ